MRSHDLTAFKGVGGADKKASTTSNLNQFYSRCRTISAYLKPLSVSNNSTSTEGLLILHRKMAVVQKLYALLLVCCVLNVVLCQNNSADSDDMDFTTVARTFSHHFLKRLSFAVIPGAFVIGVITTLLAALTVVSMKGLGVGVILLILAIGQMLSRALPPVHAAAAYSAPAAPVPIVYSHSHTQQPVWLEKEW